MRHGDGDNRQPEYGPEPYVREAIRYLDPGRGSSRQSQNGNVETSSNRQSRDGSLVLMVAMLAAGSVWAIVLFVMLYSM